MSNDSSQNVTNNAFGNPLSTESKVLDTGAGLAQVSLIRGLSPYLISAMEGDHCLLYLGFQPRQANLRSPQCIPRLRHRPWPLCRSKPLLHPSERRSRFPSLPPQPLISIAITDQCTLRRRTSVPHLRHTTLQRTPYRR